MKLRRTAARRIVRRLRDSRGATLVEAAIITPLLLLMTFAIVDFASLFYVYLALENGASQATRYGVTGQIAPGMTREESIKAAMRSATPTLTLDDSVFSFTHLPADSTTWASGPGPEDAIVKLTITYRWQLMTPLIRPFFTGGAIDVRVESAMKNEKRFN
jgi:Flp pilus assembly protein TadG